MKETKKWPVSGAQLSWEIISPLEEEKNGSFIIRQAPLCSLGATVAVSVNGVLVSHANVFPADVAPDDG